MSELKILVVDDDIHIRRLLRGTLTRASYAVVEAETGREAVKLAATARPDAILLDLGLPDCDGLELVPLFLQRHKVPLLVVSAREDTQEKVTALDLGADDYVTKPFESDELLARLRAALRHRANGQEAGPVLYADDLAIDIVHRVVTKKDVEIHLTRKEFDVLARLAQSPGRVVVHSRILEFVWPLESDRRIEYLRTVVRNLRQKIETDPSHPMIVRNELGIGYRLIINA